MKKILYMLFAVGLMTSCAKEEMACDSQFRTVERRLTFGAEFAQSVEPFQTRAVSSVGNLIILLFDTNDLLVEILSNPTGNTITKTIRCVPNQFYTVVYLANCYGSLRFNTQLRLGTTRITDIFNLNIAPDHIDGGDLFAYGKHKKILTIEDPTIPIVATLTPKVARVKLVLPATENKTNKKYQLWYQSKIALSLTMDGTTLGYETGYVSSVTNFLWTGSEYRLYLPVHAPGVANTPQMTVRAFNLSNSLLEERRLTVVTGMAITMGRGYVIKIANKFPDAAPAATPVYTLSEELETDKW
ncbi:MAG: hypothetical protein RSB23_05995 [Alistipes sp.]